MLASIPFDNSQIVWILPSIQIGHESDQSSECFDHQPMEKRLRCNGKVDGDNMNHLKKYMLGAAFALNFGNAAYAQFSQDIVKIGVISDMSGPYSAITGEGIVRAVDLAIKDFGGNVQGKPIQIVTANHQGKVDIASTKAREWFDTANVDLIIEATDSASAIAMQKIAAEKKKPIIFAGSGTSALTNKECSPYGIQWTWNTYSMAAGTARALLNEGGTSWYFVTADYAFGKQMESDVTQAVIAAKGEVLGITRHPINAPDFASILLQAQASKAKVVGFANAGMDTQNAIRQAAEFGLTKAQTLAALLIFDSDIKGLGLKLAQGLQFTTAFYWDATPETRDFSKRFFAVHKAMPSMSQAGAYSAAMHYLKAVAAKNTDSPDVVLAQMHASPVNDVFAKGGQIRVDGLHVHDMYLAEVKKPSESTGEWDLVRIKRTIPGAEAFQPLSVSECPLVKR
jgi:branched-chain amino acid transport system substrate-binding protein